MNNFSTASDDECIAAYQKYSNLKLAANSVGVKWQTLYSRLVKNGVSVCGDKSKYGSMADKIGARGEKDFAMLVPSAIDQNKSVFQAPFDFDVFGYAVDVKSSIKKSSSKTTSAKRWAFSIKRQESICDFFVFIAYADNCFDIEKVFLIPAEIARFLQSISISDTGKSKWNDYEVDRNDLLAFFESLIAA